MKKLKYIFICSALTALLLAQAAKAEVHIPILEGAVYSAITGQRVQSGHVEVLDFNVNPPAVLYLAPINSYGEYQLVNLNFPELDGIRIMAYPSDLSWDKYQTDGNSYPSNPLGGANGEIGPVSLLEAQIVNNTYTLDILVDWIDVAKIYTLDQNYPNPFNPSTTISFGIPNEANVTLKVYDMSGQEVATLIDNQLLAPGIRKVTFDGSNLSSGIYFYNLTTNEFFDTKKMILIK